MTRDKFGPVTIKVDSRVIFFLIIKSLIKFKTKTVIYPHANSPNYMSTLKVTTQSYFLKGLNNSLKLLKRCS